MNQQLSVRSFPHAILHIDADSFFASCEQSVDMSLRGKPVVTGKERGICSAASYEAKALGVKRGMPLHEIRKACPDCVILPSNYELYSLMSMRMFEVVRRYTSEVEEYSIDECFADISGLRSPLKMSYPDIAQAIKKELDTELGMSFSVGLAPTKVLAKVGSKWDKPSGCVAIPARDAHIFLKELSTEDIWGIGRQTAEYLRKQGILTALDFACKPREWIEKYLAKPYQEIWHELRGQCVYVIDTKPHTEYQSVSKTKTFTPPSDDKVFVFSQLSKNIENACIKLRRHGLSTKNIVVFLKKQDYRIHGIELSLMQTTATPSEIVRVVEEHFDNIYAASTLYRATGVVFRELRVGGAQQDLFGGHVKVQEVKKVFDVVDDLAKRYGKHTVFLGSSFKAMKEPTHNNAREAKPDRESSGKLKGETGRKRLNIPIIGEV